MSLQTIAILPVPKAAFEVTANCIGLPVTFINRTVYEGSSEVTYQWIFPESDTVLNAQPTHVFEHEGAYTVRLQAFSKECPVDVSSVSRNVIITSLPKGHRTLFNAVLNQSVQLSTATMGTNYLWTPAIFLNNNNTGQPVFTGTRETEYRVSLLNSAGCPLTDTVEVRLFKEATLWVPTAFTPNGDGTNDWLYPIMAGMQRLLLFRVWNRWGELVFETSSQRLGWDGTSGGKPLPTGNFVWTAEAVSAAGNTVFRKGNTILIR